MQVILLEKVVNLGVLGDVVKVKDGYGRNYLIPQGKAKRATPKAIDEFASRRAELERQQADKHAAAEAIANQLSAMTVTIARKAGLDGHLFGSVSQHDIVEALAAKGFTLDKSVVKMPHGHLKALGEFPVELSLFTDVHCEITVHVVGE